jgi:putative hydrolase of the HAD superfamily
VDAVIFDLDDTLVNSQSAWHRGFGEIIVDLWDKYPMISNYESPEAIYEGPIRQGIIEAQKFSSNSEWSEVYIDSAFRDFFGNNLGLSEKVCMDLAFKYKVAWPKYLTLFDDVQDIIEYCFGRIPLGIITNGLTQDQNLKLDIVIGERKLRDYFDVCLISEEMNITKPCEEIFKKACSILRVKANNVMFVGDNPYDDVEGANNAGMISVWLNRPTNRFGGPSKANYEIESLDGLLDIN